MCDKKAGGFNRFAFGIFIIFVIGVVLGLPAFAEEGEMIAYVGYKVEAGGERVDVGGVPFLKKVVGVPAKEGEAVTIEAGGLRAEAMYLSGCVYSVDRAYGNWGGTDGRVNYFIGNHGGDVVIRYASGVEDTVPLVFGYSLWWRVSYNTSREPFDSNHAARGLLDMSLCVYNGIKGGDEPYMVRIALRGEAVESVRIVDDANKEGYAVIDGVTFEKVTDEGGIDEERFEKFDTEAIEVSEWLAEHTIKSADGFPEIRRRAMEKIQWLLYTRPADINMETIESVKADVNEANFSGPKVKFGGSVIAELMTRIYYENSQQALERIGEDGMVHESAKGADNYLGGYGGYTPGLAPYYDTAYTRLRTLTVLSDMGFLDKTEKAIDFFDKWLMYFPNSYPELQLGGKPVPGHATVIANTPHVYFDVLRHHGWPTKYTTRDFGNPEPDGHGMLMLTRWRSWVKGGRDAEWVKKHWEALNEAAEYIPWALDNPELSFSEHGLIYGETEGGLGTMSMFNNYPCYLGLLSYAEMADCIGEMEKATRWRGQADRMFKAMEAYYPEKSEEWGEVWNIEKAGGWGPTSTLTPVIIGMDLWGYDVVNKLPKEWLERTRRSYPMVLSHNKPRECNCWSMGYGQSFLTQSALLFDEMADASKMADWLARYCFAPRQKFPYRVPESSVMDLNAEMWGRRGDLGNLFQLAEVVYTTHVIIGVDDLDEKTLKLMPRMPLDWDRMMISEWPVRVTSGGESVLAKMGFEIKRGEENSVFEMDVRVDKPVDHMRVRVGPFAASAESVEISVDGKKVTKKLEKSGDSKWVWVELEKSSGGKIRAQAISK